MKPTDVVVIVAFVAQMQPAQKFNDFTPDAWSEVLADVPADLDMARAAVVRLAKRQMWFTPGEVRTEILRALRPSELAAPAPERAIEWRAESANAARVERNARGAALAKAAVRPFPGAVREDAAEVPENLRKAREVAKAHKAGNAYRDRNLKLGAAGGQLMNQLSKQRDSLSRSRKE
jgi:hypothetical protein